MLRKKPLFVITLVLSSFCFNVLPAREGLTAQQQGNGGKASRTETASQTREKISMLNMHVEGRQRTPTVGHHHLRSLFGHFLVKQKNRGFNFGGGDPCRPLGY